MAHVAEANIPGLSDTPAVSRLFAWVIFALTFGLLLSDYMSRQVLNAVFPLLKTEWGLSDTQLGSLSGVVALMVGLLTFPLSLAADRWGRIASLKIMALVWSLATLACGLAGNYGEMFAARFVVGVGEAAYGSVGVALVLSVFPAHLRSTLAGAFLAGGMFGSVLGMAVGGVVAAKLGWRWSFHAMALFGLLVLAAFAIIVTERRVAPEMEEGARQSRTRTSRFSFHTLIPGLFSARSVICAYLGSGLQLVIVGALVAWMPSYLNRNYGLATDRASVGAAAFVLLSGIGMIACGAVADRVSRKDPSNKFNMAIVYAIATFAFFFVGFRLEPGVAQLAFVGVGIFFAAGTAGPAAAMVANVTHISIHATAFATLSLANNLLGMAHGPMIAGAISDRWGLLAAFQWLPFMCLAAALAFTIGKRYYASDVARLEAQSGGPA